MTDSRENLVASLLAKGDDAAPAILFRDQQVSYGELRRQVAAVAASLREDGHSRGADEPDESVEEIGQAGDSSRAVVAGERVGLLAENGPFWVSAYLGTIAAGKCAVPLPGDVDEETLAEIVASTGMRRMFVSPRYDRRIAQQAERIGLQRINELPAPDAGPSSAASLASTQRPVAAAATLAAIMFTSGSTGRPKGVMVSHRNLAVNTRDIVEYLGLTAADRAMLVLPLYYCYGASVLHSHLAVGASVVINNQFMFPEKVLDDLAERGCTNLSGVPSTYQILLRNTRFATREFPTLRLFQQAGGKLADPYIRELRAAFPQVTYYLMYGQTEATARLSYLPPERLADKLGSIGRGLPGVRLEVLREDGAPVPPGSDEIGEVAAQGESIALGYWRDPTETARYFRNGRLYTGDLARVDAEGFLYIVDRARDFIKSMGNRVSSKEIESVIAELPEVVEVAVIGMPDEIWGEALVAFVTQRGGGALSSAEIRAHCSAKLPNYKVPQRVEMVAALPKTAAGKINKPALRQAVPLPDDASQ